MNSGEYGLQYERIDHPGSGYVLPAHQGGQLDFRRFREHDWDAFTDISCSEGVFSAPELAFYPNGGLTLPHTKEVK